MLRRRDPRRAARRPAALRRGRARRGAGGGGTFAPGDRLPRLPGRALSPSGRATAWPVGRQPAARRVAGSRDGRGARRRPRHARRMDDLRPPAAGSGAARGRTLADLAAMPGLGVARLEPRASGAGRGHLLWHPARAAALLYVFGLPSARRAYRIELELDDGRVQPGPAFEPGPEGDAVLPIRLPVVGARLRGVTVVEEPGARPVLGAQLGAVPAGG